MKKIPMRSCIVTQEKLAKKDLEVIKKCKKNKILDRKLGIEIPDKIYEELINMV